MTDRQWDGDDVPAVTVRQMVLNHEGRLVAVERHVERAAPALWDPRDGVVPRMQLVEDRQERIDAMFALVKWTLGFAGFGVALAILDIIGQAVGVLK